MCNPPGSGQRGNAHSGCSALKSSLIFLAASTYTARSDEGSAFHRSPSSTDTAAFVLKADVHAGLLEDAVLMAVQEGGTGSSPGARGAI